jgi:outer membrane lipoprotein SlyB
MRVLFFVLMVALMGCSTDRSESNPVYTETETDTVAKVGIQTRTVKNIFAYYNGKVVSTTIEYYTGDVKDSSIVKTTSGSNIKSFYEYDGNDTYIYTEDIK